MVSIFNSKNDRMGKKSGWRRQLNEKCEYEKRDIRNEKESSVYRKAKTTIQYKPCGGSVKTQASRECIALQVQGEEDTWRNRIPKGGALDGLKAGARPPRIPGWPIIAIVVKKDA